MATQVGTALEIPGSRRGQGDLASMESSEERKYLVEFTDASANSIDARNASGVPAWGAKLGSYSLYLMQKSAERAPKSDTTWIVTVQYKTLDPQEPQPHINASTSKWSIVKTIAGFPVEEPVQVDLAATICRNVIGEPLTPPITQLVYDKKITISFLTNSSTYGLTMSDAEGSLNADNVFLTIGGTNFSYSASTLFLQVANLGDQFDQDGNAIGAASLEILWRRDGWVEKRPNLSLLQISGGKIVPILNDHNQPVSEPRFLDASGTPIAGGGSITLNSFFTKLAASWTTLLDGLTT